MKQLLLSLMFTCSLGILFSSCGGAAGGDDMATLQRKVDSLTKLLPAEGNVFQNRFSASARAARNVTTMPWAADYLVPADGANQQIQNWHAVVKATTALHWDVNKNRTAFMVPANTLDSLINSKNADYVVFYLGINTDGDKTINLFYTGVTQDDTTLSEMEFKNSNQVKCVFDLSYPCPKCNSIGIHVPSEGIGGQTPAVIDAEVDGGNGTVSPNGISTYYKSPTNAKFTFKPDNGYQIDEVTLDGTLQTVTNNELTIPVQAGTQARELKVKFKSK
jgi:hypothetical protein